MISVTIAADHVLDLLLKKHISNRLSKLTRNVASPGGLVWVARPEGNLATLRVSADPWAVKGPRGLVKRPQMPKSIMMTCMRDTLLQPNLSHIDFPDGAAAFH